MVQSSYIPPTEKGSQGFVGFDVYPEDDGRLDLKTGEVFQNPLYARMTKDKTIGGTLHVQPAFHDTHYKSSNMAYFEAHSSTDGVGDMAASVDFACCLSPNDFAALVDNLRSQLLPSTVTVYLKDDVGDKASPIKREWGGEIKWNNTASRLIPIESVAFAYDLLGATADGVAAEAISIPEIMKAQTREIKEQLTSLRHDLTVFTRTIMFILVGAVALYFFLPRK